jgi:hypothetical protein
MVALPHFIATTLVCKPSCMTAYPVESEDWIAAAFPNHQTALQTQGPAPTQSLCAQNFQQPHKALADKFSSTPINHLRALARPSFSNDSTRNLQHHLKP